MTVSSRISGDGKELVIAIDDRFDFSLHQLFRDAYSSITTQDLSYVLESS